MILMSAKNRGRMVPDDDHLSLKLVCKCTNRMYSVHTR